jgi:hypothetical protein
MSEEVVKLVVISPLLSLAGFYSPPFRLRTENPIKIALEKNDEEVRGRIDILVLQELPLRDASYRMTLSLGFYPFAV